MPEVDHDVAWVPDTFPVCRADEKPTVSLTAVEFAKRAETFGARALWMLKVAAKVCVSCAVTPSSHAWGEGEGEGEGEGQGSV